MIAALIWNTDAGIVVEAGNARSVLERAQTRTLTKMTRSVAIAQEQAFAPPVMVTDRH